MAKGRPGGLVNSDTEPNRKRPVLVTGRFEKPGCAAIV